LYKKQELYKIDNDYDDNDYDDNVDSFLSDAWYDEYLNDNIFNDNIFNDNIFNDSVFNDEDDLIYVLEAMKYHNINIYNKYTLEQTCSFLLHKILMCNC